jgi:hypothetical protein
MLAALAIRASFKAFCLTRLTRALKARRSRYHSHVSKLPDDGHRCRDDGLDVMVQLAGQN